MVFHAAEVVVPYDSALVCRLIPAALLLSLGWVSTASAGTFGAAVSVQHRKVAELAGDQVQYREGGPGLVLTARGDGRNAPMARLDLAKTHLGAGDAHWMSRLEVERQHAMGPFFVGSRVAFAAEGTEQHGVCSNHFQFAPTAGMRLDAGPAKVRLSAGTPAVGVLARRGRTALAPDLVDAQWANKVAVPAALYATGPWNAPAVDLTGRATWAVPTGEAWVAVRTTFDKLDVAAVQRRVTTVQPEVGFRWGRSKDTPDARDTPPVMIPPVVVPPVEPVIIVPPGVVPPVLFVPSEPEEDAAEAPAEPEAATEPSAEPTEPEVDEVP